MRGLANASEVAAFRRYLEAAAASGTFERRPIEERDTYSAAFLQSFNLWRVDEAVRRFVFAPRFAKAAADLLGVLAVRLYHDQALCKEPGGGHTPWHQDQPYYNVEGRQNASFWIPVDPVSRESSLELVAGSHLGPWLMPRSFMDAQAKWFPEGSLADLPNIEAARDAFPILGWELQPGDAVCFHMLTLHAAQGVSGPNRRRVFSVRFLGDDITHAPRRWRTSPEFPGLRDELPAGAPMNDPRFPVLWRAA